MRRTTAVLICTLVAACGSDDSTTDAGTGTEAPAGTEATSATEASSPPDAGTGPATGPAAISASDQTGDGATVRVDAVELPTAGFVVIHADAGGTPGPILGWSDLLPPGESTDIVVTLSDPITADATVFPMAHVDANGNGRYEFAPPDVTIDVPALTTDGSVAVVPLGYRLDNDGGDGALGTTIALRSTELGEFVVDGEGNTLYLFVPDSAGPSTCYDECEAAWPILGAVEAVGDGVDAGLLATTTRTDGSIQTTYNGWPLYYYAGDVAPGDVNGQGVGDVWYVVDAAGQAIT